MAMDKCKSCGASLDTLFYTCPYCGAKRADAELLKRADTAYNATDLEAARKFYNGILASDSKNAQAYWGLFLLDFGAKDGIIKRDGNCIRVTAESYLAMNLTEQLYESIVANENLLHALKYAKGELKKVAEEFRAWLEERRGELDLERTDPAFKKRADAMRAAFAPITPKGDNQTNSFSVNEQPNSFYDSRLDDDTPQTKSKKQSKSAKAKAERMQLNVKAEAEEVTYSQPKKPKITAGKCAVSAACSLPIIVELLFIFLIPYIGFLAENADVSSWGWQALSVPMKVSFLSVIVLGVLIQVLGLFGKINKPLGMATQIVTFLLFILSVYAANNNADSELIQWGVALLVPISLIVAALRYLTADGFGFLDDFNFWHYIPIALEVAEYIVFFLLFALTFEASASLWIFVAMSVITVAAIAVSSFWEDFRWIAVGINFAAAALLCLVNWLGILFESEWMWNGGIILVVILAIGGSWFIHWFIHRNDV